jgi:glycosyltransferase involved in cell wall biosynthesis
MLAARGWEWHGVYAYYFHFLELAARYPAQVIVAHDLPVLASAIVAAHSLGACIAYDAHELYPEQHHFKPEYVDVLSRAEAELIGHADLVTTVNRSIAEEMAIRYGIARPAVILNAPAASPKTLPLQRNNLIRDRLGLAASQKILLFQGGLSPNRNLDTLVRAMAFVRHLETVLVFIGPDGGKRDELEQIAGELGSLGSRIYFLDPVPQDELLSWTAGADVGIIPYPPIDLNSSLCTPNKLFEFIVAEVPILANDLPELRRFVVENCFGIARSMHSPEAIAAAVDEMMSSDPSAWRAALCARSAEFIWELQGNELVRLYERFRTSGLADFQDIALTPDIGSDVEQKL